MKASKSYGFKGLKLLVFVLIAELVFTGCPESQRPEIYKVGLLSGVASFDSVIDTFKSRMTELGYVEGQNITYDFQSADADNKKMVQMAEKFVADGVDLILTTTTGAAKACREATKGTDISVVFTIIVDAVGSGLVDDLRRPGGNVTGVSRPDDVFLGKRVEFLKTLSPDIKKLWILYDPNYPNASGSVPALRNAASALNIELVETKISTAEELIGELNKRSGMDNAGVDAIHIMPDTFNSKCAQQILEFAAEHGLPVAGNKPSHAKDGALFSYCDDNVVTGNLAATLADKLLRGASSADTPVLFCEPRLYFNYKTLESLGLNPDAGLLSQAVEIYH
jgi:putative ABC transport system substrate-binding protein